MAMGLAGMGGAAGAGDAIQQLFQQRMQAAQFAERQKEFQQQMAQEDALTRLKYQELADAAKQRVEVSRQLEADRRATQNRLNFPLLPRTGLSPDTVQQMTTGPGALPSDLFPPEAANAPAPPAAIAAPDQPSGPQPLPGTIANAPAPAQRMFTRIPTPQETATDRAQAGVQRLMSLYPVGSRERAALEYETATGKNAPTALLTDPNAKFDEFKRQHDYSVAHPIVSPATGDNRLDRSYQYSQGRLDKISKPLEDQQVRMSRLLESLNQATPQSDALVAPELLTTIAGGQGSGLRMNEAEIRRIVNGRSKWEDLKATLQQWASDPSKANSITPEQRQEMRALTTAINAKTQKALSILNDANDALINAPDEAAHRKIVADAKRQLQALNDGTGEATPAANVPKVGDVVMVRGQRVRITAIHSDGTFDGNPVK